MRKENSARLGSSSLAAAMAGGDSSIDVRRTDPAPRPERHPDEVAVLLEEPMVPYLPIAVVALTGSLLPDLRRLMARLTAEAAKIGGDAVLLIKQKESLGLGARVIVFPTSG